MDQFWSHLGPFGPSWAYLGTLFGPVWGFLGLLEAILGHLGRILGPRASKTPPGWLCPCPVIANFAHFGAHSGAQNLHLFGHFWDHFLDNFLVTFLTTFGAHFGVYFGTRSAQEGGKMSPRGPSRASKNQKAAFPKTLKNIRFFKVFGVQRPPRRASRGPRRLPRGTQRAPKPQKKGSKNEPQN